MVEDFQTPLPFSLGLGRVLHADTLAVGGSQVFKFLGVQARFYVLLDGERGCSMRLYCFHMAFQRLDFT